MYTFEVYSYESRCGLQIVHDKKTNGQTLRPLTEPFEMFFIQQQTNNTPELQYCCLQTLRHQAHNDKQLYFK